MVDWIPVEIGMPISYKPVLVEGGCAYWDGTYWYTYMERNHPRIEWKVECWALIPKPSVDCPNCVALRDELAELYHGKFTVLSKV